jgi:hypothetical protein
MAKWKFWQKKPSYDESELPEEVREYYESSQSNTRARAVLVGVATLIVTLIVAYLLYLAGSWVFNQFQEETIDTPETVGVVDTGEEPAVTDNRTGDEQGENQIGDINRGDSANGEVTIPGDPAPEEDIANDNAEQTPSSLPSDAQTESETSRNTQSQPQTAPQTGDGVSEVPNTGPGDMVAIFIATTVIATLGYGLVQKQTN